MAETPTYSHFDIERYLQHTMSPQEMHAFEKALMDDPFLADAMEGFAAANATLADAHLAGIEDQLTGRREKAKVVPLVNNKTAWWKAAAIVMIIGSGGFISYSLLYKHENNLPIAQQITADSTREVASQPDSTVPAVKPLASQDIALNKKLPASPHGNSPFIKPFLMAKTPPTVVNSTKEDTIRTGLAGSVAGVSLLDSEATAFRSKNETAKPVNLMKVSSGQVLHEFRGKVTDMNSEPVSFATIIDSNTHTGTVADANGNFVMKVSDTATRVMVSNPGYSSLTATISSNSKLNNVALEKNAQSLSEVVVGYGSIKKKRMAAPDSSGAAEPVGGWKNFGQYLNRQIDSLQAKDSKNLYNNQNIVLEFSIDEAGNPSDIKVKEQANEAVAGKAIEILSNGPKWTKKKRDKKVKVVIPFGRVK